MRSSSWVEGVQGIISVAARGCIFEGEWEGEALVAVGESEDVIDDPRVCRGVFYGLCCASAMGEVHGVVEPDCFREAVLEIRVGRADRCVGLVAVVDVALGEADDVAWIPELGRVRRFRWRL